MTAVISVPEELNEKTFEAVIEQVGAQPADAALLVDARHTTFGTPFAITSLLCLAQSRSVKPAFAIPETHSTATYWARAGFFHFAEDLFELHGKPPSLRSRTDSDVWLPITSIARSEDVHSVVERIQDRAEAILENELKADPRMIGRFAMTLSESCQNIVEHAGRGGWVMVQSYTWRPLGRRVVQIAVADAGVGFRESLAPTHARRFGDRWSDGRALEEAVVKGQSRFTDPGRGQGFAGIKRFLSQWEGKIAVRSGTARIAIVPTWDSDVPLREGLSSFPGAQVLIVIPGRNA
ncbi:MAG TPA: ATP-binding protein [Gemmatimonadaceae bacterium]|nr:ATP-binding protein [Gemmatimonadaceae bacterium]